MAKINRTERCIELRDKNRGELRAEVDSRGENDWTALHYAAFNGNSKLVSFLLYHEASIDSLTTNLQTPLMIAAQR